MSNLKEKNQYRFRIQTKDGKFKDCGTIKGSWKTLDQARKEVDHKKGERIVEHDGIRILWEIL